MNMSKTAHEIMHHVTIVTPPGYKKQSSDQKTADRERAKFIFDQQPELMKHRGFKSAEELVNKFWEDPHGQLPLAPNEI
jgi:hypothetical protein